MTASHQFIASSHLHYLPAGETHPSNTYFHFSFAEYYDPENIQFGVLRVLNDDEVQPFSGFGRHSHRDVEIVSYIVSGELTHWDSANDAEETIGPGEVQVITAGDGVMHSEWNHGKDPCRLLQIWFYPPRRSLPVRYETKRFKPEERKNRLLHIVGNPFNRDQAPLYLNQDINLYVCELDDQQTAIDFDLNENRQAYVTLIDGSLDISGFGNMSPRDSLKLTEPTSLKFSLAGKNAHWMILEMPLAE
jgi:redox-sensitive bicupin YhaK (pirin superfamily)